MPRSRQLCKKASNQGLACKFRGLVRDCRGEKQTGIYILQGPGWGGIERGTKKRGTGTEMIEFTWHLNCLPEFTTLPQSWDELWLPRPTNLGHRGAQSSLAKSQPCRLDTEEALDKVFKVCNSVHWSQSSSTESEERLCILHDFLNLRTYSQGHTSTKTHSLSRDGGEGEGVHTYWPLLLRF